MTSPTFHVSVPCGDVIVGTGGVLSALMTIGDEVLVAPCESVTRSRVEYVPADTYVREGLTAVESSNWPSPSRSQA